MSDQYHQVDKTDKVVLRQINIVHCNAQYPFGTKIDELILAQFLISVVIWQIFIYTYFEKHYEASATGNLGVLGETLSSIALSMIRPSKSEVCDKTKFVPIG